MKRTDGGSSPEPESLNQMFYCITRITFDPDSTEAHDKRSLGHFARRVRERFGVAVAPMGGTSDDPVMGLAVAAVGEREDKLSSTMDAVVKFCEDDGFARIGSESSFIEPVE